MLRAEFVAVGVGLIRITKVELTHSDESGGSSRVGVSSVSLAAAGWIDDGS